MSSIAPVTSSDCWSGRISCSPAWTIRTRMPRFEALSKRKRPASCGVFAGTVYTARTTEVRARLGLASELTAMNRPADAISELQHVVAMRPIEPIGARERAERELRAAIARSAPR